MRTSREADFRKLKITLVTMTYHSQHPQRPSLSPHVLLQMCIKRDLVTECAKNGIWLPNVQKTGSVGYQMCKKQDVVTKCAKIVIWLPDKQ